MDRARLALLIGQLHLRIVDLEEQVAMQQAALDAAEARLAGAAEETAC